METKCRCYSLWREDEVTLRRLVDLLLLHQLRQRVVDDLCGRRGHVGESHAQLAAHVLDGRRLALGGQVHDDIAQRLGQRGELPLDRRRHNAIVNVTCKQRAKERRSALPTSISWATFKANDRPGNSAAFGQLNLLAFFAATAHKINKSRKNREKQTVWLFGRPGSSEWSKP